MANLAKKRNNTKSSNNSSIFWKTTGAEVSFNPLKAYESMDEDKIFTIFTDERFSVSETNGSSLSVLFNTGKELKQIGWLGTVQRDEEIEVGDWPHICEETRIHGVFRSATADEVLDMF